MRYEDTSGTFSAAGTPDARDDADLLPSGSHAPATGNVISGAGTTTGSAGADTPGTGLVVALRGAAGTDSSDTGASLHVAGRYGTLTMDEHGNYKYVPEPRAPQGVRDVFNYTLETKDGRDTAELVINLGDRITVSENAQRIVPGPDGVVNLPPGVTLSDVHVVGRDLVVTLPDGSQIVIVDGAVFVPQLVLGGVEVPSSNLASLLIENEQIVQPAGGTPQSSGGNFDVPVPPLDPGTPLGDLIPPTELIFGQPRFEEIGQFIDREPEAGTASAQLDDDAQQGGNPGGIGDVEPTLSSVSGSLPGDGGDGTLEWALLASGTLPSGFSFSPQANGDMWILQGGVHVLTITVNEDTGAYTVTQIAAIDHPAGGDENDLSFIINYTVTDDDGDTATGSLTVNVDDDTPTVSVTAGSDANVILTTHDHLTIGAGQDSFSTTADFSNVFGATSFSPGADGAGPGTTSGYALSTTGGASGLFSHGVAINLYNIGGVIVGSTSTTAPASVNDASVVFTVSTTNTGIVTLTQFQQIDHTNTDPTPTGPGFEDHIISLADGAITLTRSLTVVDGDGDSVTGSASVQIGANLHFLDDGPTIGVVGEGEPQLTVDETDLSVNASASFAANFSANFGADGPAANSITYALGINAGATGLIDVATGQAIVLVTNGGVVEGHVGSAAGALAFTVSVDATGTVTLDQIRALQHPNPANPDDSVTLNADNLVTLTATAHDFDGDTATATLNIGTNLHFEDDGPSISTTGSEPSLTVDETDLSINASASVAGAFTSSFGADGAGTVAYALGVNAGATGLIDVATGQPIVLVNNAGVIEGHVGNAAGAIAFTVSIDANTGVVTLDQVRALQHPNPANPDDSVTLANDNLITVTATVTDRDGDTATAVLNFGQNLNFEDDGPSITLSGSEPTLTVDETILATNASASFAGAFTPVFGADGPGAPSVTYALSINAGATGLIDVATGQAIVLVNNGGTIEGHVGNAAGALAFTVSVAANGDVTLDQIRALQHPNPANPDDSVTLANDNLIVLTATAHDGDGDTASAALNIGTNLNFEDDGPSINANGEQPSLTVDETVLATNASTSFAGVFISSFGADGAGTITYALGISAPGAASGLTDVATGQSIVLVNNGGVIEGHVGSTGGALAFTVSIDANTGVVTLDQIRALTHPNPNNPDDNVTLSADNLVTITATITDRDGDSQSATANIGQNLNFEDDGPSISTTGVEPQLRVDETVLATNDTQSFAANFSSSFGADGAGTVTYALSILSAGANSGLVDTLTGQPIILVMNGSVVEGHVGNALGAIAFTVTVDSSGQVTLDQQRAVVHPNPANPDDSITLSADNLVQLTATVTDRDGDSQSATLNIGSNLNFEDDGPTAHNDTDTILNGGTSATGNVITGVGTNEGAANADSSGADSPAHITGISGVSPIDTTFSGGFLDATGVHGTLQIDANGNYTYTRTDNVQGTVQDTFTYTLTDADGDSVTATLTITMTDNAPNAPGNVTVLLDDDALLNGIAGGPGDRSPDTQNTTGTLVATGGDGDLDYFIAAVQNLPTGFTSNLTSLAGVQTLQISQNGTLVITVTLTNETGDYTVVQNAPIQHALDGDTEGEIPVGNILSAINVSVFAQDADGDPSPNGTISISVDDDTPTVTADGAQPSLTVDETVLATNDSASFAGIFTHAFGADGAAAANSIVYTLGINAGSTGLTDVATGDPIVLVLNGNVVEGHVLNAGGAIAFTVSVNSAGTVTLDQVRALTHPNTANPDDSVTLSADNLITLTQTVTDHDGDHASATANIGQNLNFEDDGPSISTTGAEPTLTVDETTLATNATQSFAANFNSSFGADNAGTLTYALSVTGGNGTASGLIDVATGSAIVLVNNAGVIEGHVATTGGALAFTVTVDASGNVTLDQIRALQHPNAANPDDNVTLSADNLVVLTATITDRDGDSASASLNIGTNLNFHDDGPSVSGPAAQSSVSVDETSAANAGFSVAVGAGFPIQSTSAAAMITATTSFGADGAGTTSYGIAIVGGGATSLQTAVGNFPITLVQIDAQTIQGQYTNGGTQVAFIVHINANGTVTLTENVPLEHNVDGGTPADFNDTLTLAGLINATVTVTDKDGDSVTSSPVGIGGNISFFDDGPHAFTPDGVQSLNGQQAPITGNLNVNMGADGLGSFVFTGTNGANAVDDAGHLLKVGGVQLHLFGFGTNHIYATTTDANGVHAYDVTLNADGTYTFDVNAVIDNGTQTSFTNLTQGAAGNVEFRGIGVDLPANNPTNTDVLLSGHSANQSTVGTTINTDSDSIGIDNQSIDPGEGVRIDLVTALVTDAGQPTGFNYSGHVLTTHFEQLIPQVQGAPSNTVSIVVNAIVADNDQVFDDNPADGIEAGESRATITGVKVIDVSAGVTYTFNADGTQGAITVDFRADGTVAISGLQAGDTYAIDTTTPFSAVIVESPDFTNGLYAASEAALIDNDVGFDLGIFSIGTQNNGTPIDQTFNVTATDSDGDFVTSHLTTTIANAVAGNSVGDNTANAAINGDAGDNVLGGNGGADTLNGNGGADFLYGGAGNDTLNGGAGNDTLVGDTGADTLTGGADNDTFVLSNAAITNGAGNIDIITDYAAGDTIDITQILSVTTATNVQTGGFLRLTTGGDLQVDLNGGGDSWTTVGHLNGALVTTSVKYDLSDGGTNTVALTPVAPAEPLGGKSSSSTMASLGSTTLSSTTQPVTNSNAILMGALAAAGLSSEPLAAHTAQSDLNSSVSSFATAAYHVQAQAPIALDDSAFSDLLSSHIDVRGMMEAQSSVLHAPSFGEANAIRAIDFGTHAPEGPSPMVQATAMPVHDQVLSAMPLSAGVAMPSAQQLAGLSEGGVAGAQHNQVVAQVLADALHGGGTNGAAIDALINALPGHGGGANPALASLASQNGGAVSFGDMGAFAGFSATHFGLPMEHAVMVHQDAAPLHA